MEKKQPLFQTIFLVTSEQQCISLWMKQHLFYEYINESQLAKLKKEYSSHPTAMKFIG